MISAGAINSLKALSNSVLRLGVGEAVSRLGSFIFLAYISRRYGVELLGVIALSQTVAMYVMLGTDQGLRLVGARLVAKHSGTSVFVIRQVLVKRLLSCGVCVAVGGIYALFGAVPQIARLYILGFVLGAIPYALSLDWLAWGLDKFAWLGAFRAGVTLIFVIGAITGIYFTGATLLSITLANGLAAAIGAFALWLAWDIGWKKKIQENNSSFQEIAQKELSWFSVLPLGVATILNQAFHNFDTILLGSMSSVAEVGRYNSAYRVIFLILGAYWLVTNSLYPRLSRVKEKPGMQKFVLKTSLGVTVMGVFVGLLLIVLAPTILTIIYGNDLHAAILLRVLAFAIPMDFCVAFLSTMFISQGFDRFVLAATGSAAVLNIILNLGLIPRYAAMGAAVATLISYVYLLLFLLQRVVRKPIFVSSMIHATVDVV